MEANGEAKRRGCRWRPASLAASCSREIEDAAEAVPRDRRIAIFVRQDLDGVRFVAQLEVICTHKITLEALKANAGDAVAFAVKRACAPLAEILARADEDADYGQ
jgi:hypothetical protein